MNKKEPQMNGCPLTAKDRLPVTFEAWTVICLYDKLFSICKQGDYCYQEQSHCCNSSNGFP